MKSERCLCTGSAADIRTPPEFQSARHDAFVRELNFPSLIPLFLLPRALLRPSLLSHRPLATLSPDPTELCDPGFTPRVSRS